MSEKKRMEKPKRSKNIFLNTSRLWGAYLFSIIISALLCLNWLIKIPSDLSVNGLFGFSPLRWALMAIFILLIGIPIVFFYYFIVHKNRAINQSSGWVRKGISFLPYLSLLGLSAGLIFLLTGPLFPSTTNQAIITRLFPMVIFIIALGIFSELFLFISSRLTQTKYKIDWLPEKKTFLFIALGLIIVFLFIILTNIGIEPVPGYWGETFPVPIFTSLFLIIDS